MRPLGPSIGAGGTTGTRPLHWCARYCKHPAPALVQAILQAPGPGVGTSDVAGNLHATMMVKLLVHVPTLCATKMIACDARYRYPPPPLVQRTAWYKINTVRTGVRRILYEINRVRTLSVRWTRLSSF